jgi:hypothetical protein
VLVAFEALHSMNGRKKGRKGCMTLKLNMRKAYDRVEWEFLERVVEKLGFDPKWIAMIITCVRTVSYSILVNGQACGKITPYRSIRQGDPLSPYLFILCAEGLSYMLRRAEVQKSISGLAISRGGMCLSHLFFADDSLLFCKAKCSEWDKM